MSSPFGPGIHILAIKRAEQETKDVMQQQYALAEVVSAHDRDNRHILMAAFDDN